jgi:hypothetical protein
MILELDDKINTMVESYVADECKEGDSKKTGLDERAFGLFWYNFDCIVIPADRRQRLDYYGGFEYVEPEHVKQYGEYVIYSAESERVADVIDSIVDSFEELADA